MIIMKQCVSVRNKIQAALIAVINAYVTAKAVNPYCKTPKKPGINYTRY